MCSTPSPLTLPSKVLKDVTSAVTVCGIERAGKHTAFV